MKKICKSCKYFKQLYRFLGCNILSDKLFYCINLNDFTRDGLGCEQWEVKKPKYDLSPERFEEVENDIKFLLEHIKEK